MNAVTTFQQAGADSVAPTLSMILRAVESGADIERIEKLMALHERYEKNEATKAFTAAMAQFRSEPMEILKTKYVDIPGGAKFHHATLSDVVDGVIGSLSKYGLRHRWEPKQEADKITVTCHITHALGHSEQTTLYGPPDRGGKKSEIQSIASTVTLLQRYTLIAAVGLAAKDMDDDPQSEGPKMAAADEPQAPSDYPNWRADTKALAEEGRQRLWAHWEKSPPDIRRHCTQHDNAFWEDCKAIANRATKKMKETEAS